MIDVQKITYNDFRYMEIPDENTFIYELLNGKIVKRTFPPSNHQITISNLITSIGSYIIRKQFGRMLMAPLDVIFDDDNATQLDIFFIKKEREKIIEMNGPVWGAPDLVIEVISEGTAKNDRIFKKELYERCGVSEYWIVDPPSKSIEVYTLDNQQYTLLDFFEIEGKLKSKLLTDLDIDLKEVFY
jgi:Uma2 family endonuclease